MAAATDAANRGDWDEALVVLDELLILAPDSAQAHLLRGQVHAALGDLSAAENNFAAALSLEPGLAAAHYQRARLYASQGNQEAALADYGAAIELAPGYAAAYRGRAELYRAMDNFAAARLDLEAYLTLLPNAPDRAEIEAQILQLLVAAEAAAGEGALLFFDDFSDPGSGWQGNGAEDAEFAYADGGYRIRVDAAPDGGAWAYSGQTFSNTRIEVLALKEAGPEDSNWFGILCRLETIENQTNFYAFIISSDGFYGIGKQVGGAPFALLSSGAMQFSNAVIQGENVNQLAAECRGSRLALHVNGVLLAEVEDSDLNRGQAGLVVGTFEEPGAQILFDDFAVYVAQP